MTVDREELVFQWKCYVARGDLGEAELIKKKIKSLGPIYEKTTVNLIEESQEIGRAHV